MGFAPSPITLSSPAFATGGLIPAAHTGTGIDVSPALAWRGANAASSAYAVICHDPDAPLISPNGTYGFVHWVLYNIPGSVTGLAEGCADFCQGVNDFGVRGYKGPMPPQGHGPHHYYFWIIELMATTSHEPGLTMWQLLERIEPITIGMNRLIGRYERK
ncbi:MAG: YbhB/YbcL family Raf kinase inhibitor-like protein [Gammaproteobacteria bacterium]|nr:YbhB/YbcL family Raf kinase inhibitor-like protein [Gammaproteobacteria bacterium]